MVIYWSLAYQSSGDRYCCVGYICEHSFWLVIESQNHRTLWVGRNLKGHLIPIPLPWAGTPSNRPGCSKSYPAWPRTLLGRGHPNWSRTLRLGASVGVGGVWVGAFWRFVGSLPCPSPYLRAERETCHCAYLLHNITVPPVYKELFLVLRNSKVGSFLKKIFFFYVTSNFWRKV